MTEAEAFLKVATMSGRFDLSPGAYMARFKVREEYIARFGFAVLTQSTVAAIARYSPLLEIGCGSGYWAYELRKAGADIVATDPGTGTYGFVKRPWKPYVEIEPLDALAAVLKYPNRSLLVVWPDYKEPWAADALRAFVGTTVLYVGEGEGGCTGDDAFHELLESHYALKEEIDIPQFDGIHDRLEVHMRLAETTVDRETEHG